MEHHICRIFILTHVRASRGAGRAPPHARQLGRARRGRWSKGHPLPQPWVGPRHRVPSCSRVAGGQAPCCLSREGTTRTRAGRSQGPAGGFRGAEGALQEAATLPGPEKWGGVPGAHLEEGACWAGVGRSRVAPAGTAGAGRPVPHRRGLQSLGCWPGGAGWCLAAARCLSRRSPLDPSAAQADALETRRLRGGPEAHSAV